jgi:hypothetical protein
MLVFFAERAALSVNVPRRIARQIIERNLEEYRELLASDSHFLRGVVHRADYHFKLIEEQRVRIGGSMRGDLVCALRGRCQGVRTLMPPRAFAALAKSWSKLMKAS